MDVKMKKESTHNFGGTEENPAISITIDHGIATDGDFQHAISMLSGVALSLNDPELIRMSEPGCR